MYSVTHAAEVGASEAVVWRLMADLGAASEWNPILASTEVVGSSRRGVGAKRQSRLTEGDGLLHEEVVDWAEGKWLTTAVTETTLPLSSARLMFGVEPCGPGRSTVVLVMEYEPKRSALSRFGGLLALRGRICRSAQRMVDGLKQAAERAVTLDRKAELRPARA